MSKKCTPLWREAHFEVKKYKTPHVRTTLGSWDVEKVYAVVARSTFPSQKCKKLRGTEHFWTFRCRFAWQAQGIVHLLKREQNLRVLYILNYNRHYTTLHDTTRLVQLHLHYSPLHYITLHSTTLHHTTLNYITLHYTTFHYTTLHYTPLHYTTTTLQYIPLHYATYITLHYAPLHSATLRSITLHYITLHSTSLHYTALH